MQRDRHGWVRAWCARRGEQGGSSCAGSSGQQQQQAGAPDSASQRCMMGVGHAALPLTARRNCGRGANAQRVSSRCIRRQAQLLVGCLQGRKLGSHPAGGGGSRRLLRGIHCVVSRQKLGVHCGHPHEHSNWVLQCE